MKAAAKRSASSFGHVQWKFPGTTTPLAAEESVEQPLQPSFNQEGTFAVTAGSKKSEPESSPCGQSFFVLASIIPQGKAEKVPLLKCIK